MGPFSRTVLLWRLERRLSQEALAKAAKISRPNLSAVERGKREVSLKTLRALALALQVRPGVLVEGIGPHELAGESLFTRESLERVAYGVTANKPVRNASEGRLVHLLQFMVHSRSDNTKGKSRSQRPERRAIDRAWLQLSAGYPPELIQSLFQRIRDREQLRRAQ